MQHGQKAGAQIIGNTTAQSRDDQELVIERRHRPVFARSRTEDINLGRFEFGQAAHFDLLQLIEGASQKQITNAVQGQPLRLEETDGDELEKVLFPVANAAARHRCVHEAKGAIITHVAFRHSFSGLAGGRGDTVLVAPFVHGLGELLDGMRGINHVPCFTYNSVTVKSFFNPSNGRNEVPFGVVDARSAAFTPLHHTLFKRITILQPRLDGHAEAA